MNKMLERTEVRDLRPEEILKLIFSYITKITNERNVDVILLQLADMGREIVVADRCTLWLLDREKGELCTRVAHGLEEVRVPAGSGIVGQAVLTGKPLLIEDAYENPHFNREVDKQTGYRTKSLLVIPIKNHQGEVMGVFQAVNKLTASQEFTTADFEYLTLTASYSGKVLESALLYQEIEETQKEIIFSMAKIGESRSKETGNHVKRVAEYSKLLALKYGLSEEDAELLRTASPMHDIGKVAISDAILKKPGKLTVEEFATMQRHTEIGYHLLKGSKRKILQAAAIIAEQHHEKWNGKGYPKGLKGEEIHIFARITAIADVFDALGSERYYKKAWELDRILQLFGEERGEHFDPKLVDCFLEHIDEIVKIRDAYEDAVEDVEALHRVE